MSNAATTQMNKMYQFSAQQLVIVFHDVRLSKFIKSVCFSQTHIKVDNSNSADMIWPGAQCYSQAKIEKK